MAVFRKKSRKQTRTRSNRRTRRRSHRRSGRKTKVHNKSKKYRKQRKLGGGETYAATRNGITEINKLTQKHTLGSQPGSRDESIQRQRRAAAAAMHPEADKPKLMDRIKINMQENAAKVRNTIKAKASQLTKQVRSTNGKRERAVETVNPAFGRGGM